MQINPELAQRIVDIIIPVVHRNVNLMDLRGVIIASGHPHRIGTVHMGARIAIENGETIEIFPDELARYPGALQGINMPIFRDERPVGVVGVFGDPPDVRSTAQFVKMITELVLERETLQRESGANRRMREEFTQLLVLHDGTELPAAARRLARSVGFDVEPPRLVALFRAGENAASTAGAAVSSLAQLPLAEIEARLLAAKVLRAGDFVATLDGAVVVLLVTAGATDAALLARVRSLRSDLAHLSGLVVRAGVGGRAAPGTFPASFRQARFALARAGNRQPVRAISEEPLLADYMRARLMADEGGIAAQPVIGRIAAAFVKRPVLRETVEALLLQNLDGTATASALGVHRNTLSYRLRQFEETTGLAPARRFADAIVCWVALGAVRTAPPGA
jgi:carbohydrate diacid regulator